MGVKTKDREFRTPKTTYLDFKFIEMDRVLTMLFPLLKYDGRPNRFRRGNKLLTVEEFVEEVKSQKETFRGFADYPEVTRRWVETDLLDLVNRGKAEQAVAAPRPLHGNSYKFRNAKHSRDYFAADQLYWMLYFARRGKGQSARENLKDFFFKGYDFNTDKYESFAANENLDVETQALMYLDANDPKRKKDEASSEAPLRVQPVCIGGADILADDVLRLLAYENHIPRAVLVDYLKTLMAFHLAVYHLRLLRMISQMVKQRSANDLCCVGKCPVDSDCDDALKGCPYSIGLAVDMGDVKNAHMAGLAQRSADRMYRQIPNFIQANFVVKKLDEMAEYLRKTNKLSGDELSAGELLSLLGKKYDPERLPYFKSRLATLVEESNSEEDDVEIAKIREMKSLDEFEKFIEIIMLDRGKYYQDYITQSLDSLLLKNKENGLLAQPRMQPRRFRLSSKLLETLLQIAVLTLKNGNIVTREIRIEELLAFLRNRYGLYIDCLPDDEKETGSILDRRALRLNLETFKKRLREIGFFEDLSDAYVTQKISPRYVIVNVNSSDESDINRRRK
jgi:hypothetical protein